MTKDFRHVGRLPVTPEAERNAPAQAAPGAKPPNQRFILRIIAFAVVGFLAAGIWLLSGGPSPLPAEISLLLGIALVISALADFAIILVLKRVWSRLHDSTGGSNNNH